MAEKALEEEAKAKEKERKARVVCAKAKEKAMFAEEKQRMWKRSMHFVMDLFCYCYVVVFWLN